MNDVAVDVTQQKRNNNKQAKFAKQYVFRKILGKHHTKTVIQLVKLFLEIKFDKLNFGLEVEFGKLDF